MISVIIPTYNEETALPETLRRLLRQPGEYEVIVVDGESTDRTCEIVRAEPRVHLLTAPKRRASQMNVGARHATGEWLLFLHADTLLPDGALVRLGELETDQTIQAGGFLHGFSGNDWRLRMVSFLDNFRCRRSRIIYGDQAMFVRRSLFERLGGFPDQPILEDVAFCEKLIRVASSSRWGSGGVSPASYSSSCTWNSAFRSSPAPSFRTSANKRYLHVIE